MIVCDPVSGAALIASTHAELSERFMLTRTNGRVVICSLYTTPTGATWLETVGVGEYSIEPVTVERMVM